MLTIKGEYGKISLLRSEFVSIFPKIVFAFSLSGHKGREGLGGSRRLTLL